MSKDLNRVMLIGRLTRDVEVRTFTNGGSVASFTLAINNSKKDQLTGEWVDDPCFIDCKVSSRGNGGNIDALMQYTQKGSQLCVEGKLKQEKWEKDGQKFSKHVIAVDDFYFIGGKQDNGKKGDYDDGAGQAEAGPVDENIPF